VMGDGFTLDSIKDYRDTIDSSLKYADKNSTDPKEVNRYNNENYVFWCNNVFEKFKDNINIIRIDTISLDESIDQTLKDEKRNILDCHLEYLFTAPNYARVEQVLTNTKPLGITDLNDIDVLIIYVNDFITSFGEYPAAIADTFFPYGKKKGQDNCVVIIKKGEIANISHELGHALVKLSDEYVMDNLLYKIFYNPQKIHNTSINCDNTNQINQSKFRNFFNHGYENLNNIYKLAFFEGGVYNVTGIYRTSEYSLMNNKYKANTNNEDILSHYHYNPISSYHIAASIITRIGVISFVLPKDLSITGNLEWQTYPLSQFFSDFPPDKFVDPK
ncbi:MAG TPA: M64 family metallopeptidase, partial [Spirochaetota bacterium]|nr:M64 family metallopeptidase [Spirochaetota bacterium]